MPKADKCSPISTAGVPVHQPSRPRLLDAGMDYVQYGRAAGRKIVGILALATVPRLFTGSEYRETDSSPTNSATLRLSNRTAFKALETTKPSLSWIIRRNLETRE